MLATCNTNAIQPLVMQYYYKRKCKFRYFALQYHSIPFQSLFQSSDQRHHYSPGYNLVIALVFSLILPRTGIEMCVNACWNEAKQFQLHNKQMKSGRYGPAFLNVKGLYKPVPHNVTTYCFKLCNHVHAVNYTLQDSK